MLEKSILPCGRRSLHVPVTIAVIAGELDLYGCDMERCPRSTGQCLGCECRTDEDDDLKMVVRSP